MFATAPRLEDIAAGGPPAGFRAGPPSGTLGAVPGVDRIRIQGFGCIEDVDTQRMLALIEHHGLAKVPPDASSLRTWIDRVRAALAPEPSG